MICRIWCILGYQIGITLHQLTCKSLEDDDASVSESPCYMRKTTLKIDMSLGDTGFLQFC